MKILLTASCKNSLPLPFLGETLDEELVDRIKATGVDVCGESGEYYTFDFDGPLFKAPIPLQIGEKIAFFFLE